MKTVLFILLLMPIILLSIVLIVRENISLLITVIIIFLSGALLGRYFWMHTIWDKNEHLNNRK